MKRFFFIVIVLVCYKQSIAAEPYDLWWQKGNTFYNQKQFDSAAFYYEKVAALNPRNAVVYYNLGNAYYRLNKIGPAVLYYERSLRIDPSYKEAKDNLALTQSRIANRVPVVPDIFFVSWWKSLTEAGKTFAWSMAALIIFILILGLILTRRYKKDTNIPSQLIGTLSVFWVLCIILAYFSAMNSVDSGRAVVMQNDAPLLNVIQGKTQSLVPEGTTVQLAEKKGDWVEIRLPDGRRGWMQLSLLSKI